MFTLRVRHTVYIERERERKRKEKIEEISKRDK